MLVPPYKAPAPTGLRCSLTQLCPALWDPVGRSTQASLSFTISQSLLKLRSIELVMPSYCLILCHPLLLPSIFPSTRVFSNESAFCIRWPKYWSFTFSISPSSEYPGLISFRMERDSQESKGLSRVFSNTTVQKHQFFGAQGQGCCRVSVSTSDFQLDQTLS